jgi:putative transposase
VTEKEIADAATALLDRAERGPASEVSRADQRVAGRTRATVPADRPRPDPAPQPMVAHDSADDEDGELAEVIPLSVFDARKEAGTWW